MCFRYYFIDWYVSYLREWSRVTMILSEWFNSYGNRNKSAVNCIPGAWDRHMVEALKFRMTKDSEIFMKWLPNQIGLVQFPFLIDFLFLFRYLTVRVTVSKNCKNYTLQCESQYLFISPLLSTLNFNLVYLIYWCRCFVCQLHSPSLHSPRKLRELCSGKLQKFNLSQLPFL